MHLFGHLSHRHHKAFGLSISMWHWSSLIATVGNMGYLPKRDWSHFGSLSVSIITPLLLLGVGTHQAWWISAALALASCLLGWAALISIHENGIPSDHDASAIVIDELAGASVATMALPCMLALLGDTSCSTALLCALLLGWLFRFLDILKPYPANAMDELWHHPFSVVADDLVAGVYAALLGIGFAACLAMV